MKKFIFYFSILSSIHTYSQLSIESSFNFVHIGRNQNLLVKHEWPSLSLKFGFKYNFNKLNSFPQADMFKKSFWAINTIEHFGCEIGIDYNIVERNDIYLFSFKIK